MSCFEDKKLKLAVFDIAAGDGWRVDVDAVRRNAACRLDGLPFENGAVNIGWACGNAELDIELDDAKIAVGENIHLAMRTATRRIPGDMLKALCRKKAAEYMRRNHCDYVGAKAKKEIRAEAEEKLIRHTVPRLRSAWCVITPKRVYAGVSGRSETECLIALFQTTFGIELGPVLDLESCRCGCCDREFLPNEFMTDLFRRADSGCGISVSPRFDFIATDDDRMCIRSLNTGNMAGDSREVQAALIDGKLLRSVRITVDGETVGGYEKRDVWSFTIHENLSLSSLSLPEPDESGFAGRFAERLELIDAIIGYLKGMLENFMERVSGNDYEKVKREWIENR